MSEYEHVPGAKIIHLKHESATIRLTDWQDATATLTNLYSKEKGKGHATALLEKVTRYIDEQGYCIVYLEARKYGPENTKALNDEQLIELYTKFGFTVVPDCEDPILMHRLRDDIIFV